MDFLQTCRETSQTVESKFFYFSDANTRAGKQRDWDHVTYPSQGSVTIAGGGTPTFSCRKFALCPFSGGGAPMSVMLWLHHSSRLCPFSSPGMVIRAATRLSCGHRNLVRSCSCYSLCFRSSPITSSNPKWKEPLNQMSKCNNSFSPKIRSPLKTDSKCQYLYF